MQIIHIQCRFYDLFIFATFPYLVNCIFITTAQKIQMAQNRKSELAIELSPRGKNSHRFENYLAVYLIGTKDKDFSSFSIYLQL